MYSTYRCQVLQLSKVQIRPFSVQQLRPAPFQSTYIPWMDIGGGGEGGAGQFFLNNIFFSDVSPTRIFFCFCSLHFFCMTRYARVFVTIVTVYEVFGKYSVPT